MHNSQLQRTVPGRFHPTGCGAPPLNWMKPSEVFGRAVASID